jgi:kelch-like protein 20
MFTGELAESRQTEIIIHDVDEFAIELLIEFCYTSRIIVDEKNVQMLLPAACILQVITKICLLCKPLLRDIHNRVGSR